MKIEELEQALEENLKDFGDEIEVLQEGRILTDEAADVAMLTLFLIQNLKDNIIEYLKSQK